MFHMKKVNLIDRTIYHNFYDPEFGHLTNMTNFYKYMTFTLVSGQ